MALAYLETLPRPFPLRAHVRMEHILRNVLLALLEQPNATMRDILRVFSDKTFRAGLAKSLKNPAVKNFLEKEFNQYSFSYRADGVASIQNKVGAFLADPLLNRILTTSKSETHVRKIMDEGKILLVNLAKGRLGALPFLAASWLRQLVLQHTVGLTLLKISAEAFLLTSMNFRASRRWLSPTCFQNCGSTG